MTRPNAPEALEPEGPEKASSLTRNPPINEKALLRRIDLKVLSMLFLVYVAVFLDRSASQGTQPNIALTIFFVPYILFEIPSNILLKHYKPHIWISGCIFGFGIAMLAQEFVQTYGGLLATRFSLGFTEAGIYPGSLYVIIFWYKCEEAQWHFTIYGCSVLIASAFGGLLASAIANMDGVRGYSSWRWIFILEGIVTVLIGFLACFYVPGFLEEAKWLTEDEKNWVLARTGREKVVDESITAKDLLGFFSQLRHIIGGITYFAMGMPIYSFGYFAPTIIKTLGYATVQTQLHTVPPFAAALALALIVAYASDYTLLRLPYVVFCISLTMTGLAILISVRNHFSPAYGKIHLVAMGAFSGGPIVICWFVMNLHGHAERSIGTAWIIGLGNIGGIVATFFFLVADAPYYTEGYTVCIAVVAIGFLATFTYGTLVWGKNKKLGAAALRGSATYFSL